MPLVPVYCSSLTVCSPGVLLGYFLNCFEVLPVAFIITGIPFVFYILYALYLNCKNLYFIIFSDSFVITFQSPEMAAFINKLYYYYYYCCWLLRLLLLWPLYFTYFTCSETVCSECILVCEVLAFCSLHLLRIQTYLYSYIAH